jgi:hypothetical protein
LRGGKWKIGSENVTLRNNSVDHEERIERMERVHEEMEDEIHCTNNMVY